MQGEPIPGDLFNYTNERFQVISARNFTVRGENRTIGNWYTATPPLSAPDGGLSPVDNFGRTLVNRITDPEITIGVIVVSIPGASIRAFHKTLYEAYYNSDNRQWMWDYYENGAYARMVELGNKAQAEGWAIKGILMHQGESDGSVNVWPGRVKEIYDDLLKDLNLKSGSIPFVAGEVSRDWQHQTGPNDGINSLTQFDNFHVISSLGAETRSDNIHFTIQGHNTLGERYANMVFDLLYR